MNTTEFTEKMKGMAAKFEKLKPEKQKKFLHFLADTSQSVEEKELSVILVDFQGILENIAMNKLMANKI